MYLHLSNITQSFILIFIFDLLFANLIGSKKHKFKGLNRGKRKTPKRDILFIIGYRNAKVGSQEISGVAGKIGDRKSVV